MRKGAGYYFYETTKGFHFRSYDKYVSHANLSMIDLKR